MSRIGKKVIAIPAKTTVTQSNGVFTVTGSLGTLSKTFRSDIEITIGTDAVTLVPKATDGATTALWGTYASHIINMIAGVTTPFVKKLIIEGIGYKSEVKATGSTASLAMALGFSHPVNIAIPEGLKVTSEKNIITITGSNKEDVGAFTALVRSQKLPEPYKGKGIRGEFEVVKRKQGKKSA